MCIIIARMDKTGTYYETLIAAYLSGEASTEERAELSAWIAADEENFRVFTEYRKSWSLFEASNIEKNMDMDAEWDAISKRLGLEEETVVREMKSAPIRRFLRVAAILLIFLGPGLFYYWNYMRPADEFIFAETHFIESTLPDGTMVSLNAGSTIQIREHFNVNERNVSLDGEAYFDVAHNKEKAFVIEAEGLNIRVLGTSFYVNTNGDENTTEVVLVSGEVKLEYNGKELLMKPGQKALVLREFGELVIRENDDPNFLSWKTEHLEFTDTPFGDIVALLQKVYHKDIVILNPEIRNCRVTATFDGQSLEAVLLVLQSTLDLNVRPNGSAIEISGNGCQ
jgi:transmembrane sensor